MPANKSEFEFPARAAYANPQAREAPRLTDP